MFFRKLFYMPAECPGRSTENDLSDDVKSPVFRKDVLSDCNIYMQKKIKYFSENPRDIFGNNIQKALDFGEKLKLC